MYAYLRNSKVYHRVELDFLDSSACDTLWFYEAASKPILSNVRPRGRRLCKRCAALKT